MKNLIVASTVCLLLLGCGGRSLLTSDLSGQEEYQTLVNQKLKLLSGDRVWLLMRDPYDPITNFSDGYKLSLVDSDWASGILSGKSKPPSTPNGPYEVIEIVDGAKINIERILEYGMETPFPVALGYIEVKSGEVYPFESEWLPFFTSQTALP